MAKLVFGLNQSLDGYVDHQEFAPGPSLTMFSAALPPPAAGIVAAASPAVLALMKSRLCIGPLLVFVAKRPSWFTAR